MSIPTMLDIAPELSLPTDAVTETFALLAKRGAGKSNAAVRMAEEMHRHGLPWVAVDPKGDWWGIRSSRDGKAPGLPVLVLGGQHGDVPLEPTAGRVVADLIAAERVTAVIDVSLMSKADARRFLADFAERLYTANTDPLHVFAEEAHEYIPQRVTAGDARMVGAWEKLVKWGRTHGLGVTLITQRSASLNKDVLTQVETLIALRTTGPQDQAQIRAWVDEHDTGAAMIAQLRKLDNGEAFVLSPQWLNLDEPLRIRFHQRTTFDSGATPRAGEKRVTPRTFADVDLAALKDAMAETIEKAKADDPKHLRARIRDLEAEVQQLRDTPAPAPTVEHVEVPVLDPAIAEQLHDDLEPLLATVAHLTGALSVLKDSQHSVYAPGVPVERRAARDREVRVRQRTAAPAETKSTASIERQPAAAGDGPSPARRKILTTLVTLESIGVTQPPKNQVALFAGVSPKSSGYANNLGGLRSAGMIGYPGPGLVTITDTGRAHADDVDAPATDDELHHQVRSILSPARWRILESLIGVWPDDMDRGELADHSGVSASSSGYANNLGALRSLGLIDYPGTGRVVAADLLFLGDAR